MMYHGGSVCFIVGLRITNGSSHLFSELDVGVHQVLREAFTSHIGWVVSLVGHGNQPMSVGYAPGSWLGP